VFFIWNVIKTWRSAPKVTVDDPWGWGGSLEWATSCPPPRHNFTSLPRIRSERPAFDMHHPELASEHITPGAVGAFTKVLAGDGKPVTKADIPAERQGDGGGAQ
jgi:cytochrome c oxidase subunit 1